MTNKKQKKPISQKNLRKQSETESPQFGSSVMKWIQPIEDEQPDSEFGWIGRRIKEIREKRNISQRELAKLCNVDTATMSRMEAGESEPSLKTLRLLAKGLNTTPSALLAKEEVELAHSIDLATANHQLVKLIEGLARSLEVAQSLLAAIQSKTDTQPPKQEPVVTSWIRKPEL